MDIPGYRYDPEKKKYFKLKPGEVWKPSETQDTKRIKKGEVIVKKDPLNSVFMKREIGDLSFPQYRRSSLINGLRNVSQRNSCDIHENGNGEGWNPNGSFLSKRKKSSFVLHWTTRSFRISFHHFSTDLNEISQVSAVDIPVRGGMITHADWGYLDKEYFMIGISGEGNSNGRCKIYELDVLEHDDTTRFSGRELTTLVAFKKSLFSCFWQENTNNVSLGITKGGMIFDVFSNQIIRRFGLQSDVLKQSISSDGVLFNCTRGGKLWTVDPRDKNISPFGPHVPKFCSKSFYGSVNPVKMQILQDEAFIMISYSDGKILLWDRRMENVVRRFTNESVSYCLDDNELFLYSLNKDNHINTYDLLSYNFVDKSPLLHLPNGSKSIIYEEDWPLYNINSGKIRKNNSYFQPVLSISIPDNNEYSLYRHNLYDNNQNNNIF